MASHGLSARGKGIAASMGIPGRYPPKEVSNRYDKEHNPEGIISFATAENALIRKELEDFVQDKLAFAYRYSTGGGPRLKAALASFLNKYFNPLASIAANELVVAPGVTPILEMLGFSLGDPGDGILVNRPIYGRFELDFGTKGTKAELVIVHTDMDDTDPFSYGAVLKYDEAINKAAARGIRVKALLITNPHNPLGQCYPKDTLYGIARLCQKHRIHLISDEVYAFSSYSLDDPNVVPFTSMLSLDLSKILDANYLHVLYGMSKDFAGAGIRVGCLSTANVDVRDACDAMAFHGVSGMSAAVASSILEDDTFVSSILSLSSRRLRENYCIATEALARAGTFGGENAISQKLIEHGVFMHPGEENSEQPGWFRLVFALPKDELEVAMKRLTSALLK
ncbi:acc synthase [Xylogone sp. PMI_703]|nr:acc synthase [Xylogone sp. PMI_703]